LTEVCKLAGRNVWQIFSEETPKVAQAWMNLSNEINIDGVLDQRTALLVRIGIYSVTRDPVALSHFVREALKAGVSKKEVQAAALMAWGTGVTVAELAIPLIKDVDDSL
jgi:alkylhydroperoxidase/carboxymuconolactone decarboxylase family protein YurZ